MEFIIEHRLIIYIVLYIIGGLGFAYHETTRMIIREGYSHTSRRFTVGGTFILVFLFWPAVIFVVAVILVSEAIGKWFIEHTNKKQCGDKTHV